MLRNWKMLSMAAALSAALSSPPVVLAQATTKVETKGIIDRFDKLEKMIAEMKTTVMSSLKVVQKDVGDLKGKLGDVEGDVANLQKDSQLQQKKLAGVDKSLASLTEAVKGLAADFGVLRQTVAGMNKSVDKLKGDSLNQRVELGKVTAKVDTLEKQLTKLQTNIDALRKRDIALYPPNGKGFDEINKKLTQIESTLASLKKNKTPAAATPTDAVNDARIVMDNRYDEYLLLVVDGESHRVNPGSAFHVGGLSPGSHTYEVISPTWGLRVQNTISLTNGETFTLTATNPN